MKLRLYQKLFKDENCQSQDMLCNWWNRMFITQTLQDLRLKYTTSLKYKKVTWLNRQYRRLSSFSGVRESQNLQTLPSEELNIAYQRITNLEMMKTWHNQKISYQFFYLMLYPEISHFNIKSLVFKTFALNVIQTTQKFLKREIFQF